MLPGEAVYVLKIHHGLLKKGLAKLFFKEKLYAFALSAIPPLFLVCEPCFGHWMTEFNTMAALIYILSDQSNCGRGVFLSSKYLGDKKQMQPTAFKDQPAAMYTIFFFVCLFFQCTLKSGPSSILCWHNTTVEPQRGLGIL